MVIANISLIAWREIRQIARTRSFLLTLFILPAALAVSLMASWANGHPPPARVLIVGYPERVQALREALRIEEGRRSMTALARSLARHAPNAPETKRLAACREWCTNTEVLRYQTAGGARAVLATLSVADQAAMRDYSDPSPDMTFANPSSIGSESPESQLSLLRPRLDSKGADRLDYVIRIAPVTAHAPPQIVVLSNKDRNDAFLATLQNALVVAQALSIDRTDGLRSSEWPNARVRVFKSTGASSSVSLKSVLPFSAAYLLLVSLLVTGSWMLQGVIEERANKLLEAILACVSPTELMYGKLAGTVAIGLAVITFWICSAIAMVIILGPKLGAGSAGGLGDVLSPSLTTLSSPLVQLAIPYFFVVGFIMVAMIFLAIGAVSDSFREAQGFLSPVLLVIILPFSLLARSLLSGGSGLAIEIMTWVPIYTPFAVLARLGSDISPIEIIGAGAVLAAFVVLELFVLGRIFRRSLLKAGERVTLFRLAKLVTASKVD